MNISLNIARHIQILELVLKITENNCCVLSEMGPGQTSPDLLACSSNNQLYVVKGRWNYIGHRSCTIMKGLQSHH